MLQDTTRELVDRIAGLDAVAERPRFAEQLVQFRPRLFETLTSALGPGPAGTVAERVAQSLLGLIKEIPFIVGSIQTAVGQRTTHPAVRCAMAGALAYFVQPRDLLHDDLPGGYGFVDDCMILRATVSEYFDVLPAGFTSVERERLNIRLLAVSVPVDQLPSFQAAIDGVWHLFHRLLMLPPDTVEATIQRIERDPLSFSLPDPAPGTNPFPPGPDITRPIAADNLKLDGEYVRLTFDDGVAMVVGA